MVSTIPLSDFDSLSRQVFFKADIYLDGLENTPVTIQNNNTLITLDILEELSADKDSFMGNVSANECRIVLDDIEQQFNPNTNTKVKKDVPLKVYTRAGLDKTWIPMGIFYVNTWTATRDSNQVSILAYDKMKTILQTQTPIIPLQLNTTVKNFLTLIFTNIGLTSEEFDIFASLQYITLPFGFTIGHTLAETLQPLLLASMSYMYVNREGKIIVLPWRGAAQAVHTLSESVDVFSSNSVASLLTELIPNSVEYNIWGEQFADIVSLHPCRLQAGENLIDNVVLQNAPVKELEYVYTDSMLVELKKISIGSSIGSLAIINTSTVPIDINLTLVGKCLQATKSTGSSNTSGKAVNSLYIQEAARANIIKAFLDNVQTCNMLSLEVSSRGNPALELGDFVTLDCPTTNINMLGRIVRMDWAYDGSLEVKYTVLNSIVVGGL